MAIDLPPHDSGSQPTLAFVPFSAEDVRRIRQWQSRIHAHPRSREAARDLMCCLEWMEVRKDGLRCHKCGREQDWVPGMVLEIDLTEEE